MFIPPKGDISYFLCCLSISDTFFLLRVQSWRILLIAFYYYFVDYCNMLTIILNVNLNILLKVCCIKYYSSSAYHPALSSLSWLFGVWESVEAKVFYPTMETIKFDEVVEFQPTLQPLLDYKYDLIFVKFILFRGAFLLDISRNPDFF